MSLDGLSAGELTVRVVSTTGRLDKDVERKVAEATKTAGDQATKGARDVAKKMRSIGTGMSLGVTLPLLAVGNAAKNAASDVIEGTNKVRVVFGEQAQAIETFAKSADKLGLARSEALAATGTFGALFSTVGLGQKPAADMSVRLTTLAADLGSFHNAMPTEALDALRSGLNGESEPLRRFGVFLNEDRVAAEAFALGLAKPVKNAVLIQEAQMKVENAAVAAADAVKKYGAESDEAIKAQAALVRSQAGLAKALQGTRPKLTEAQKAQARYAIILRDTKLAQGDVARSASTSAAVQESIAKAQAKNAQAALGEALIPLSIQASKTIGKLAGAFNRMSPQAQKAVVVTAGLLAVLGPLLTVGGNVGRVVGFVTRAVTSETAAKIANAVATKAAAAAQWLLNAAMSANPIALLVLALVGLVAIFVVAYRHSETFRRIVTATFGAVTKAATAALGWLRRNWPAVLAVLAGPFGLAVLAIVKHWDKVKGAATSATQWIRDRWNGIVDFVKGLPGRIGAATAGMWDGIKNAFRNVVNTIIGWWNGLDFTLPKVHVKGTNVDIGGFTLGTPDIPKLREGGLVRHRPGGVLARVAEAGEDELVAPLSKLEAMLGPRTVFNEGAIKVYNPAPEPASSSVHKRIRRLAVMGVV